MPVELLEVDFLGDLVVLEQAGDLGEVLVVEVLQDVLDGDLLLALEDGADAVEGHELLDHAGEFALDHGDPAGEVSEAAGVDAAPRGGLRLG